MIIFQHFFDLVVVLCGKLLNRLSRGSHFGDAGKLRRPLHDAGNRPQAKNAAKHVDILLQLLGSLGIPSLKALSRPTRTSTITLLVPATAPTAPIP